MTPGRRMLLATLCGALLGCAGSTAAPGTATSPPAPESALAPPSMALVDTSAELLDTDDFDALHSPIGADAGLILGALPIEPAGADVPASVAAFLGRWEGYGLAPPIRRDRKYVLAVTEITRSDGNAHMWAATNLQYPAAVQRIHFRVREAGPDTAIEWEQTINGAYAVVSIRHARGTEALEGGSASAAPEARLSSVLLRKDSTLAVVYRDHAAHLAGLGITWRAHADAGLASFGAGSLVYLPPGYEDDPTRRWPLILFLHGSGDRGDNGYVIAQNSAFRFVTQGNALDAIVVAPLLGIAQPTFPTVYLAGVLDDALDRYRVDRSKVAVTGLSMGGESAYRLARHRPADVAALAVLCGFDAAAFPQAQSWGYAPIPDPPEALAGMPVLVVHGRDDTIVPLEAATATVDALRAAGVDVRLEVLEHHDHDVWSDTYADPAFFTWLLDSGSER